MADSLLEIKHVLDDTSFAIRPARPLDKGFVLAFCAHTFDWGDYLPLVWDMWLSDDRGPLLVATENAVPVGVAKVTLLTPTEAWLEGLRVDPRCRRHGMASQFQTRCLELARQMGARVARLATGSQNWAVRKTAERAGMCHVASFLPLEASALSAREEGCRLLRPNARGWPQVAAHILEGSYLSETRGLYGAGWTWEALTRTKLRAHWNQRQVLTLRNPTGEILATAITTQPELEDKCLPVAYADGAAPYAETLAHALRQHAGFLGLEKVEAMLPAASAPLAAFLSAGYAAGMEVDAEEWIYEVIWEGATH
jgi:GNAT superfamily N-acetyltransferase